MSSQRSIPPPRNISLQKNFRDSLKKPLAALPLVVLLASCGGGSGGSGGGGSGGGNGISRQEPPNPPSNYEPRPASWSVTQSTNTDDIITTQPYQRGGLDDGITIREPLENLPSH